MQDFRNFNDHKVKDQGVKRLPREAAPAPVPNEYGGIYDKPKIPKIGFIKARMNKDNFWNVVFFLGMNIGFGISYLIVSLAENGFPASASIVCWLTILGIPYIVKKNSNLTFNKENSTFIDRNGGAIKKTAAEFVLLMFFSSGLVGLVGLIFDSFKDAINFKIAFTFVFMIPTLIPTLYCILKNFPIAVYFKKEAWIGNGNYSSTYSPIAYLSHSAMSTSSHHSNSMSNPSNLYFNPSYRSYSGNSFNR